MNYNDETQPIQPIEAPHPVSAQRQYHRRRQRRSKWLRPLRRLARKIKWVSVFIVLIAAIVVAIVGGLALMADTMNQVNSSLSSLTRVSQSLRGKPGTELTLNDFNRLQSSVTDLAGSLSTARSRLNLARPFRAWNGDLNATITLVDASQNLTLAANDMLNALQPTLFFLVSGDDEESVAVQISSGERIVELLRLGRGLFLEASARLETARIEIEKLDLSHLTPAVILNIEGMTRYHDQLVEINHILQQAPDLLTAALGLAGEQNYLILSQNSDELRPSGGYISTYGWMNVRNGRITDYSYSPTTATSPNPPGAQFADQIVVPDWWIQYGEPIYAAWDGSWYADFSQTAEMSMWYYNAGNNPRSPVSGVLAIDIIGFEMILKSLGSVVVPGYEEVVTLENFRHIVYAKSAENQADDLHKRFIASVYQQIFTDWQNADPDLNARLLGAVLEALQEKHIMFYSADDTVNAAINLLGWSGTQKPAVNEDYLMTADANLGNKSNRSIVRQLTLDVDIQPDGSLVNRAAIAYDYSARVADLDPGFNPPFLGPADYNNLLQVFTPLGSAIIESGNFESDPETIYTDTQTIFATRLTVPYDSSERFQLSYRTPPLVESFGSYRRYRLLLQKQPGTLGDQVNVQVTLPAGATPITITPTPAASYVLDRPILEFLLTLESDQSIEIIYQTE
jgi:Protein of unknown function (DUF4012)